MNAVFDTTAIAERFHARPAGNGWIAHCPGPLHAHGDRSASLSIAEGENGRTVIHCFAGCDTGELLRSAGLSYSDLFADQRAPQESRPTLSIERQVLSDLRPRLTRRERVLSPVIIITTPEQLDAAIVRALTLAAVGQKIIQIAFAEDQCK